MLLTSLCNASKKQAKERALDMEEAAEKGFLLKKRQVCTRKELMRAYRRRRLVRSEALYLYPTLCHWQIALFLIIPSSSFCMSASPPIYPTNHSSLRNPNQGLAINYVPRTDDICECMCTIWSCDKGCAHQHSILIHFKLDSIHIRKWIDSMRIRSGLAPLRL